MRNKYANQIAHMPYMPYIWWVYMETCIPPELTSINHVTRNTVNILQKLHFMFCHSLLDKHGYHTKYIGHTAIILYAHIDPPMVYICAKHQTTVTCSSHHIGIDVPQTNSDIKLHSHVIYVKYLMAYIGDAYTYMCHIWSHWFLPYNQECCTQKTLTMPTMMTKSWLHMLSCSMSQINH